MTRRLLLAAALAGAAACAAHNASTPAGGTAPPAAYMLLADGSIHDWSGSAPAGFYVEGRRTGDGFAPAGNVKGSGTLGAEGHPGWLELSNGRFYGDETGRPPFKPYVKGYRSADGRFRPSSRDAVY
jgi:hypothetical protein